MEDYNNYNNNEDFYQIPPKPAYPVDNKIYDSYDYNLGVGTDMNSNLPRPATPTSPITPTYINAPLRISSPIPRISSPAPRISSPVPRINSPIQRINSPVQRINSPIQRINSPVPRINSPIQRINSPTPRINSPISRDVANLPLNSNFNFDFLSSSNNVEVDSARYDDMKGLRNSNSYASLRPQKINDIKNLRNSNSTTSLNNLRNQQQLQQQLQQQQLQQEFQQQQQQQQQYQQEFQQFQPLPQPQPQPEQQQLVTSKPFDIAQTPQDQLQKLLIQAKVITNQLQSLSTQDTKLEIYKEGKLPSYEKLVKVVSEKFQVQREINQANARLLTINYIVNITNFCRTHQLHQNIVEGQKKITELETTIQMLEDFIEDINVENENNKLTAERLKSSLDDTRALLENAIKEYRKEMDDHRKILRKQNNYIDSIQNSKFNQDLLVDAGIFCVAAYIVNLPLIDFPLHSIFQTLMRPGRRRAFTKQLAKLIMIALIIRKLRRFAVQYGIHNKIGSFSPYLFKIINFLIPAIYQNEIKDMTDFLLRRNKKPEIKKVESLEDMDSDVEIVTQE